MQHKDLHSKNISTTSLKDDGKERLIVDPKGVICFAGENIRTVLGVDKSNPPYGQANDVFEFIDRENAFQSFDRPMFGVASAPKNCFFVDSLHEGVHEIRSASGETAYIFFNRISIEKGDYIVGSLITSDGGKEETLKKEKLKGWVSDTFGTAPGKVTQEKPKGKGSSADISLSSSDIKNFMDMSNDLMATCGKDGVIRKVNDALLEAFGLDAQNIEDTQFADLVAEEDRPYIRPSLLHVLNGETESNQITDFEARMACADGTVKIVEWRQKKFGHSIYLVGRDITKLREKEDLLKKQKKQLSEAQTIGKMGHWTWNLTDQTISFSGEVHRIFGTDSEQFTPCVDSVSKLIHRRDLGRALQSFQRAMIDKKDFEMEFRVTPDDVTPRYVRCLGRCEIDTEGDVTALFGIMQDMTQVKEHENELKAAKDSAESAYATKSQFLANMSHELRTPLNAIIGFSEMIERQLLGPIGTEKYLDYISGIRESGEHLLDMITDILDMSKIEAGKYELDIEQVNIVKLIKLAVHMMEGRALDDSIKLSVEADNEDLIAQLDRRAVMQVLLNLLSNAVKFSKNASTVRVECLEREDYIAIKVHDTGIGIPASKLAVITKPFEQVSNQYSRDHEGSGLGLAITKELAELHGGALHIESKVGAGTVVTIRLPYDARLTRKDFVLEDSKIN